jgi:hypothetical protein
VSRFLGTLALSLLLACSLRGQTGLGPERRDVNDLRGDFWAVLTAPVHANAGVVAPITGMALGVLAVASVDSNVYAWMATHPDARVMRALRPLREKWKFPLYELGSGQYLLPLSGIAYVAGRLSHNAELRDAGMGCITGHLSSAVLRDMIYLSVARVRPHESPSAYRISFPGTHDWMRHSFLSGHTANSMACASFFGHRYALGAIEPLSYAYVTAIGLGRVADGWHWPSDTMAGAIMGFAIGKFVADRQRVREEGRSRSLTASSAAPLRIGWSFDF